MNHKGDIPSILYFIVALFIAGVTLLVFSFIFTNLYQEVDDYLSDSKYNDTTAHNTLQEVQNYEESMWDYVFLAIAIGYVITLVILGFSTQVNAIFYFIYGIVVLVGLFVGVALSNTWETLVETDALSSTVARFPITDLILNNFYPLFIIVTIVITMIVLFGKNYLGTGEGMR